MDKSTYSKITDQSVITSLKRNSVLCVFVVMAVFIVVLSGNTALSIANDVSSRFFRNLLLIVALVLPIVSGIGLNFGITLGAMSAQIAVITVMVMGLHTTAAAYPLCILLTVLLSAASGYLLSVLFNKTKGKEMIAGLLGGFFANGINMLILMVVFGVIIKVSDPYLVAMKGAPIKTTISLSENMMYALDKTIQIQYLYALAIGYILIVLYYSYRLIKKLRTRTQGGKRTDIMVLAATTLLLVFCLVNTTARSILTEMDFPIITFLICALIMAFVWWFLQTKLGHDYNSIKYNARISASAGLNVDGIRTNAVILSTVIAGLGHIIFLQNLGSFNAYTTHNNIGTHAIAAILVGGATVKNANLKNAIIGNLLFQIIYSGAPNAAKNLIGNAQVGEYFREFLCYGIITVAIIINVFNETRAIKREAEG